MSALRTPQDTIRTFTSSAREFRTAAELLEARAALKRKFFPPPPKIDVAIDESDVRKALKRDGALSRETRQRRKGDVIEITVPVRPQQIRNMYRKLPKASTERLSFRRNDKTNVSVYEIRMWAANTYEYPAQTKREITRRRMLDMALGRRLVNKSIRELTADLGLSSFRTIYIALALFAPMFKFIDSEYNPSQPEEYVKIAVRMAESAGLYQTTFDYTLGLHRDPVAAA